MPTQQSPVQAKNFMALDSPNTLPGRGLELPYQRRIFITPAPKRWLEGVPHLKLKDHLDERVKPEGTAALSLKYDVLLSTVFRPEEAFYRGETPLLLNVRKEELLV